jgi:hypothetical protein
VRQIFRNELFVSFIFTIISSVGFYFLFKNWQLAMVAGLVLGLYSYVYGLYNLFSKENHEALKLSRDFLEKCLSLLSIEDLYSNNWLQDTLNRMVAIEKSAERHQTFLNFARTEISRGINEAEGVLRGKKIDYSGWKKEAERQVWLKDIVVSSKTYIKAVTSYDPVYWDNFWNRRGFSDEYTSVNIAAAKRGVLIDRIFILPDIILNGTDENSCNQIRRIVSPMLGQSSNLRIYFVSADRMPQATSQYKTVNFLVADDLFVGFSEDFAKQTETNGYVSIACQDEVEKVLFIYRNLAMDAHLAEGYDFLKTEIVERS